MGKMGIQALNRALNKAELQIELSRTSTYRREYYPLEDDTGILFGNYETSSWAGKAYRKDKTPLSIKDFEVIATESKKQGLRMFFSQTTKETQYKHLESDELFVYVTKTVSFTDILRVFKAEVKDLKQSGRLLQEDENEIFLYQSINEWEAELRLILADAVNPEKMSDTFPRVMKWKTNLYEGWDSISPLLKKVDAAKSKRVVRKIVRCFNLYKLS